MDKNTIYISCPHCHDIVEIPRNGINCGIFRHGVFKSSWTPMNPHESKQNCDKFAKQGLIYGCGKPFRVSVSSATTYIASICEYI